jgi:hypothetical protein
VESLPSPEYYVELVGVVAVVNAIDRLASILDLELLPIADASLGEPTRPEIASSISSHWVPTALDAQGANVLKASSVAPAVVEMRTRIGATHYLPADGTGTPLDAGTEKVSGELREALGLDDLVSTRLDPTAKALR